MRGGIPVCDVVGTLRWTFFYSFLIIVTRLKHNRDTSLVMFWRSDCGCGQYCVAND